jgi:TM2 domain-containing membrane protein YozV
MHAWCTHTARLPRLFPFAHFDLGRIYLKSVGSGHMAEIVNGLGVEVTFLAICIQSVLAESFKDFRNMSEMIVFVT